ncbi:BRCT domain-containing protein [Dioszegia hungarica]|uniref:BRCT domain-containing protein n=1 Tax=Dioszegia hungarica TaxID=4972 RepID=A0AA38HB38_9TREE|nr:BRCT domain-containing protein [Dioszegia hungarica]KAI9637868.1 BRCT domain-containing protein [Dioszegia hungarica]
MAPTPLTPSSSQEIVPISPPPPAALKRKREVTDPSASITLPKPLEWKPSIDLKDKAYRARNAYEQKVDTQGGKKKARQAEVEKQREEVRGMSREKQTARMLSTLGKEVNPITNSDLYSRTDHFVSAATGHQQSNRGGGSAGAGTYWEVRTAKMEEQARAKKSDLLKGLVFYINGSTGPRVSNLQLQHLITANGGRFVPMQSASCTHILASGGLSGTKTQKWIDGQGGRGSAKRMKVVSVDWLLDSVEKGVKLSEAGYGMITDPSQHNLFSAFGTKPKKELQGEDEG